MHLPRSVRQVADDAGLGLQFQLVVGPHRPIGRPVDYHVRDADVPVDASFFADHQRAGFATNGRYVALYLPPDALLGRCMPFLLSKMGTPRGFANAFAQIRRAIGTPRVPSIVARNTTRPAKSSLALPPRMTSGRSWQMSSL